MADFIYQVKFLSDWHCGSGLTSGSDVDALVIKDQNNLPIIPGKTIKGLLREAAETIV
ncbi:MAG: RAMP superfamily CRISPR-associated protein, partial [Candidatus Cloacimonetes bacterium]|nr:RAMP superfamily CRISPR-associated protein [Candidatus Cloacimonadota bacterium]